MVVYCVAYGCQNLHNVRTDIKFHRFPFTRPEILNLWVTAIRRQDWYPSKTSRLCSEHFVDTDYITKPGSSVKLLKLEAVPSVFSFPKHLQKKTNPRKVLVRHNENVNMIDSEPQSDIEMISLTEKTKTFVNMGTQTISRIPQESLLRKKIINLNQKVRRRNKTITSLENLMNELRKNGCTTDNLTTVMSNYFKGRFTRTSINKKNNKFICEMSSTS